MTPTLARAQSYRIQSITVGRAAQYARSDGTTAAPRLFQQRLSLRAHDLLNAKDGSLNAYLMMDYATDLSLEEDLRNDPSFLGQYNALRLELAQLQWRPGLGFEFNLGRQWTWGALGFGDFDGARIQWKTGHHDHLSARLNTWFGRVANHQQGWLAHTTFDIQGLPEESLRSPLGALVAGASVGMGWVDTIEADVQYTRRWTTETPLSDGTTSSEPLIHDERLGAALVFMPFARLNANINATYHLPLSTLTDLRMDLALRVLDTLVITGGARRQTPWFDTASIFNLFEPRPHDDVYLNGQLNVPTLNSTFQLRTWTRAFHGDDDTLDLGQDRLDATATGVGLTHYTIATLGAKRIQWSSTLSMQWGDELTMGDQGLIDTSIRTSALINNLFITGRLLLLGVWRTHHRIEDEYAATMVVGLDYPILGSGQLSVFVEQHMPTQTPWRTDIYGSLSIDFWP